MTALDAALRSALQTLWQDRDTVLSFCEAFLDAEVHVPIKRTGQDGPEKRSGTDSARVPFFYSRLNGQAALPVFDRIDCLREWIDDDLEVLTLSGHELIKLHSGRASIALNPHAVQSRLLGAAEIKRLRALAAKRAPSPSEPQPTETQKIEYSPDPANAGDFVAKAKAHLSKQNSVKAAYLVAVHDRSSKDLNHLLLMVDIEGDRMAMEKTIGDALADAALGTLPEGSRVETALFDPKAGVGAVIDQDKVPPFYTREHGDTSDPRDLR